ncbi:hypothetical protein [Cellulomonas soli]
MHPSPHRQIRRSGRRLHVLVRTVLTVLVAAPFVALTLLGIDDWHHVGPHAIDGTATTTHCRKGDGDITACFGTFTSLDGTLTLRDVEIRLDRQPDHTGPATAAPGGGGWVAAGEGRGRMIALLIAQALTVSGIWLIAYGVVIAGLITLVVSWTVRQLGRALAPAVVLRPGPPRDDGTTHDRLGGGARPGSTS